MEQITYCKDCANQRDRKCLAYPKVENFVDGTTEFQYCSVTRAWDEKKPVCSRFVPRLSRLTRLRIWLIKFRIEIC